MCDLNFIVLSINCTSRMKSSRQHIALGSKWMIPVSQPCCTSHCMYYPMYNTWPTIVSIEHILYIYEQNRDEKRLCYSWIFQYWMLLNGYVGEREVNLRVHSPLFYGEPITINNRIILQYMLSCLFRRMHSASLWTFFWFFSSFSQNLESLPIKVEPLTVGNGETQKESQATNSKATTSGDHPN